jgi:hypothetical protein
VTREVYILRAIKTSVYLLSKCGEVFLIAPKQAISKNSNAERISPTSALALCSSEGSIENAETCVTAYH